MASPAPEFELTKCLAQAKERGASLVELSSNLTGWTPLTNSSIPKSMKIYERRSGTIFRWRPFFRFLALVTSLTRPPYSIRALATSLITVRGEIEGIKAPVRTKGAFAFLFVSSCERALRLTHRFDTTHLRSNSSLYHTSIIFLIEIWGF